MIQYFAEIGLNHLGSEQRAEETLDQLLEAEVDGITFQIREKAFYNSLESSRRRLSEKFYEQAVQKTHQAKKKFGIATCDPDVIPFFCEIGIDFWKMLSWDFTNSVLAESLLSTQKTVYMSTGVSSMDEIRQVTSKNPSVFLIHTSLSQDIKDVNLRAIEFMRQVTQKSPAFGLHCPNFDVLKLAISFSPLAMFFYVKEVGVSGLFDDQHAVATGAVKNMIKQLRVLEAAIGEGDKISMKKPDWVVS